MTDVRTKILCAYCGERKRYPDEFPVHHYAKCGECFKKARELAEETKKKVRRGWLIFLGLLLAALMTYVLVGCFHSRIALKEDGKTVIPERQKIDTWSFDYPASSYINEKILIIDNHAGLQSSWTCTKEVDDYGLADGDFIAYVIASLKKSGLWEKTLNIRWLPKVTLGGKELIDAAIVYLPKEEK